MSIGKLEPLYRYLKTIGRTEPVSRFLSDIEQLAKGGHLVNASDGIVAIKETTKSEAEIAEILRGMMPHPMAHHMMYQAIGKQMFLSLSRVRDCTSKTALALCIDERDQVIVDYLEHQALFHEAIMHKTLWNSISTVVVNDAGEAKRGFIRAETTFIPDEACDVMGIKCDFKLSRTKPFYLKLSNCRETPTGVFGAAAKDFFETQESKWNA